VELAFSIAINYILHVGVKKYDKNRKSIDFKNLIAPFSVLPFSLSVSGHSVINGFGGFVFIRVWLGLDTSRFLCLER